MRQIQRDTLNRIDSAIQSLYDNRLVHFRTTQRRYNDLRARFLADALAGDPNAGKPMMMYLGFETMVCAELYSALQNQFDPFSVFMELPGLGQDRIDLYVDYVDAKRLGPSYRGYLELKMYYNKDEVAYRHDFEKLKEMAMADQDAVAVQVHFELYQNTSQSNHRLIDGFAASLDPSEYWYDVTTIGDDMFHFYRLSFGKN